MALTMGKSGEIFHAPFLTQKPLHIKDTVFKQADSPTVDRDLREISGSQPSGLKACVRELEDLVCLCAHRDNEKPANVNPEVCKLYL